MTCHPRGKNYGDRTPPGPDVPHGGTPVAPQCPLPSRGDALLSEQGPGIVVVMSCTKLPQPRVHLCQPRLRVCEVGGLRRSYRNGRASAVAEGTPFPQGTPESRRWGERLAGTCHPAHVGTAGLLPVYTSVFAVISARAYPPLPGGQV